MPNRAPFDKDIFMEILREVGLEATACKQAGYALASYRKAKKEDPEFSEQVDDVLELYYDSIEAEAHRRAVQGVEEDVFYQGGVVGTKTVYSDALLTTVLKSRRPKVYGDKKEISGPNGATLEFVVRNFDDLA